MWLCATGADIITSAIYNHQKQLLALQITFSDGTNDEVLSINCTSVTGRRNAISPHAQSPSTLMANFMILHSFQYEQISNGNFISY